MKYRCLIADDEPPARKLLSDYVSKIGNLELAGVCSNGVEVVEFLSENTVDILLLDIRMPLMTGMEILNGYELDVIDYLMKPVPFERFQKAIDKAIEYLAVQVAADDNSGKPDYFFIKTDTRIVKFMFAEVSAIEAQREYIKIIAGSRKVMSLVSLTSIANVLPPDFVRIHRSYIINMRHIDEVQSNEVVIGKEIYPISRNYREVFFEKLGDRKLL